MLQKSNSPNTAVCQPSLGASFENYNLTPNTRKDFRSMYADLRKTVAILRQLMTKPPTRKRLDERKHQLAHADKQEKTACILRELFDLDAMNCIPKHLRWLNTRGRILSLAHNAESMKRRGEVFFVGSCSREDSTLSIDWAVRIIERDFQGDYEAERQLRVLRQVLSGNPGFFPTSAAVAQTAYSLLPDLEDGDVLLEPSAGTGDFALEIIRLYKRDGVNVFVECVEWNYSLYQILIEQTANIIPHRCNFLDFIPKQTYKVVIMNPPFDDALAHIKRAYRSVEPGGVLLSIVPAGFDRPQKHTRQFLKMAQRNGVNFYNLPKDAFVVSGTNTRTAIMVLPKGEFD